MISNHIFHLIRKIFRDVSFLWGFQVATEKPSKFQALNVKVSSASSDRRCPAG